jgi:hypothetical protein
MRDKSNQADPDNSMRTFLTVYTTLQALFFVIFFGCAPFLHLRLRQNEAMDIVQLLMPILTGYLGLMLGFYFGSEKRK